MHKARHSRKKTVLLIVLVLVLIALAAAATLFFLSKHLSKTSVTVFPVSDIYLDYDSANQSQTDGSVSADRLQSVYVSATQQVTEIYVTEGQTVSVGDPLLAFDTTLSNLELERQNIKISQLELDIQNTEKELEEISAYRVGTPAEPIYIEPTRTLEYPETLPWYRNGIGTESDPMVYLWTDDAPFNEELIASLAARSAELRAAADTETGAGETGTDVIARSDATRQSVSSSDNPESSSDPSEELSPSPSPSPMPEPVDPNIYVVFEIRADNAINGDILRAWEMVLFPEEDGTYSFRVTEPSYTPDLPENDTEGVWYEDTNVYYTAAEVAKLKADASQKLADLKIDLKKAELEYDRLSYELSNGVVYSTVDGVVKTVRDVEEAQNENKPVLLISGGGGYTVTAALGELELGTMQLGDTVSIQSWENYETFAGTIAEISEYPDDSGNLWYYSEGNQNISLYPFKIFVDEDAELREGEYVTVTYSADGDESGIYLENVFLRQDSGKSYVYAVGSDGLLEKRYVRTGANLWGSYTEILDGLTMEDAVAFPYGRDTEPGAPVAYGDISDLYSYAGG